MAYYLDEFTFRFNRRKSKSRGKLFYRLVQQAVTTAPAPYDQLVAKPEKYLLIQTTSAWGYISEVHS